MLKTQQQQPARKKSRRRGRRSKQPRSQKKIKQDVDRYLNFLKNQTGKGPAVKQTNKPVPHPAAGLSQVQLQQYLYAFQQQQQQQMQAALQLQQQQHMNNLVQMQNALVKMSLNSEVTRTSMHSASTSSRAPFILVDPKPVRGDVVLLRKAGASSRILVVRNASDMEQVCKYFAKFGSIQITVCHSSTGACAIVRYHKASEAALAFHSTQASDSNYTCAYAEDPLLVLHPFAPAPPSPPMSGSVSPKGRISSGSESASDSEGSISGLCLESDSSSPASPVVTKHKPRIVNFNPNATSFLPSLKPRNAVATAKEWRSRKNSKSAPARYAKGPVAGQNFATRRAQVPKKCSLVVSLGGIDLD